MASTTSSPGYHFGAWRRSLTPTLKAYAVMIHSALALSACSPRRIPTQVRHAAWYCVAVP